MAEILNQPHQGDALIGGKLIRKGQIDQVDRLIKLGYRENNAMRTVIEEIQYRRHFLAAAIQ